MCISLLQFQCYEKSNFMFIFVLMNLEFFKYQGTGNDFIIIDNRTNFFDKQDVSLINKLCDRKYGVGADGLILLENSKDSDFKMIYYNADGNEGTMCGNGGRCIVAFAKHLAIITNKTTFDAIDGLHYATIKDNLVNLQMIDVNIVSEYDSHLFLNTGSPHHITFTQDIKNLDVTSLGASIRYGEPYNAKGTNVNFVEQVNKNTFSVRTYERGVEAETLSCGTGVTAVAIAAFKSKKTTAKTVILNTLGGTLEVNFDFKDNVYKSVFLKGPTNMVFKGSFLRT